MADSQNITNQTPRTMLGTIPGAALAAAAVAMPMPLVASNSSDAELLSMEPRLLSLLEKRRAALREHSDGR